MYWIELRNGVIIGQALAHHKTNEKNSTLWQDNNVRYPKPKTRL
jgi:hypothetical protein